MSDAAGDDQEQAAPRILSIDDILAVDDLEEREVFIPEWGGALKVRALSRNEILRATRMATDRKGDYDNNAFQRFLVCWASVEPKITPPIFDKLADKKAGAVYALLAAVLALSAVDDESLARARAAFRSGP